MAKKHIAHDYDTNSRSFNDGAHKHWRGMSPSQIERAVNIDRGYLAQVRDRRGYYERQVSDISSTDRFGGTPA